MKMLTIKFFILILFSCTYKEKDYIDYGEVLHASHKISIYEILGNLDWYNNQPISIRGGASFDFHSESASGIYAKKDDFENSTYGWLVLDLKNISKDSFQSLVSLNGEFISVHGIFHAYERTKIPHPTDNENIISICKGICGAAGFIEVIRITE
jgi:hypothetical protein